MVVGLLGNESPDSNRFTLVTPKSENDVRLQATLANQNPTGLPVGIVSILSSEDSDGYWLHTRGMAEFGRPDIGISCVPEDKIHDYTQLINQMIYYGGQGVFFENDKRLHTSDGKSFVVHPEFVNDFENDDYNNAYYNVTIIEDIQ